MAAADIIGVIIGGSTIALLLLVIVLFRSVYIVLPRKELHEKYVLRDALVEPQEAEPENAEEEEPALA